MAKYDLKRHKLLGILVDKTLKFDSGLLPSNEPMGVSFDEIKKKMNCNIEKLNLIAAELYVNEEIKHHDNLGVNGMSCIWNGKVSFSSNKYSRRYWNDILDFNFKLSQILIPLISLIIALTAVIESKSDKRNTIDLNKIESGIEQIKSEQESLTKEIQNIRETILLKNSTYAR